MLSIAVVDRKARLLILWKVLLVSFLKTLANSRERFCIVMTAAKRDTKILK